MRSAPSTAAHRVSPRLLLILVVAVGLLPAVPVAAAVPALELQVPEAPPVSDEDREPVLAALDEDGVRNPEEALPADLAGSTPAEALEGLEPVPALGGPSYDVYGTGPGHAAHVMALYPEDVNVQDPQGHWVKTATMLQAGPLGWEADLGPVSVRFPTLLASGTRVELPAGTLTTVPLNLGVAAVEGSRDGATVLYPGALASTDLRYTLTAHGYREEAILNGPGAPDSFSWQIAAQGLSLSWGDGGNIRIMAGAERVGTIPAMVAYDSSPAIRETLPQTTLEDLGGGLYVLEAALDPAFLQEATYPVVLDPREEVWHPTRDGYVNQSSPDRSYEGSVYLKVGPGLRSFLRFDDSHVREGRLVYWAELNVAVVSQGTQSEPAVAKQVTDPWPTTLTWNTQPGVGATAGDGTGPTGDWLKVKAESVYQRYLDGTWTDRGLRLSSADHKTFYADDAGGNARPVLHIVWNDFPHAPVPTEPADGAVVETPSPTLRIDHIPGDPNGDDVLVQFQISTDKNDFVGEQLEWSSPWVDDKSYIVPAGVLTDGQAYYWRARSWDVCQEPDVMCKKTGGDGVQKELPASDPRKVVVSLKHFGDDPKYSMWSQDLGNDMSLKVNHANGNLFLDLPLDVLKTPVDDLAVSLTYNHQQGGDFGMGPGWELSAGPASSGRLLPTKLVEMPEDQGVKIRLRDSSFLYFPHRGGRVYGGTGAGSVKKQDGGGFTYTTPEGGTFTFGALGLLKQAKPAATSDGYAGQAFTYQFSAEERLQSVTDALGRKVTFHWSVPSGGTANRLTSIQTWDNRTWTLGYGTSGTRITTVSIPDGATAGFTYDAGGRLTEVRDGAWTSSDPTGWKVAYWQDPKGLYRVDAVTPPGLPAGQHWDFSWPEFAANYRGTTAAWSNVTDPRGTVTAVEGDYLTRFDFNWAALAVQVTGPPVEVKPDGSSVRHVTTQVWDTNNNLVCRRSPEANAISLGCKPDATADPLNTEYRYQNDPPYPLLEATQPAPNPDGTGKRLVEAYGYDQGPDFNGLWVEKFANPSLSGIPAAQVMWDQPMEHNWGTGSPVGISDGNNWSLRWTGLLHVPKTSKYRFRAFSDDGISVTVGNRVLVDCFGKTADWAYDKYNCGSGQDAVKRLWPGDKPITVEFQEKTGDARFKLQWNEGKGAGDADFAVLGPASLDPQTGLLTTRTVEGHRKTTYDYPTGDLKARRLPRTETATDLTGRAQVASRTTTYAYDDYGRITSVADPLGKTTSHAYTGACLTQTTDRTGAVTKYECNGAGDVIKQTTVIRKVTGEGGQPDQPAQERVTVTEYDPLGRVDKVSQGTAGSLKLLTDNAYDEAGRLLSVTHKLGRTDVVTRYEYDAMGRRTKETLPDPDLEGSGYPAPVTVYAYDPVGNEVSRTDPRGLTWQSAYDALDRLTDAKDPFCALYGDADARCSITRTAYSVKDRTTTVTDPAGIPTVTAFDLRGRKVSHKVGTLPASTFSYDAAGNVLRETDPAGVWTDRTYDGFGQVVTESRPHTSTQAATTAFAYDAGGRLTSTDGPRTDVSDVTTYGYDAEGRLVSVKLPLASTVDTTTYRYSDAGERVRVIDADGRVRSWAFDVRGRVATSSDARGTTTYVHDDLSRLVEVRLPTGLTQKFGYDNLGRRIRRYGVKDGSTVDDERFAYDPAGNMTEARGSAAASCPPAGSPGASDNTVCLSYDPAGRPATVAYGGQTTTTYTYAQGRLGTVTDRGGTTTYAYQAGTGLLASLTDPFNTVHTYAYDGFGRPVRRESGGTSGFKVTRAYDAAGRVDNQKTTAASTGAEMAYFDLSYDRGGNVVSREARVQGWPAEEKGTWSYSYDAANRLTWASVPGGKTTYTYAYDGAGNRTSVTTSTLLNDCGMFDCQDWQTTTVTTSYDAAGHPVSSSDGTMYATDATGALTGVTKGGATRTYSYDAWGRLAKAVLPSSTATYAYDALDRTTTRTEGDTETTFSYQGTGEEVARTTDRTLSTGAEATTTFAHSPGGPLGQRTGTALRYFVRDLHTDVVGLMDPSGASKGSVAYSPWGERRATSGEKSLLGFQGDLTDLSTGLVDMTARNYDPSLGRFTTRDPVFGEPSNPLSLNQFVYGMDSPVTTTDPTGMVCLGGPCPAPIASGGGGGGGGGGGCLDALSCGGGSGGSTTSGTGYQPKPQMPELNLTVKQFAAKSIQWRIDWLMDFQAYFKTRGWFNAQLSVLRYFEDHGISRWASFVDAAILHSIAAGAALLRGEPVAGNENLKAARGWFRFLKVQRDPLQQGNIDLLKRRWASAEQAATDYGVAHATAAPTTRDVMLYQGSQVYRDGVGHPAAVRALARSPARLSPSVAVLPFSQDPVRFFDPRNGAGVTAGLNLIHTAWVTCLVCQVADGL